MNSTYSLEENKELRDYQLKIAKDVATEFSETLKKIVLPDGVNRGNKSYIPHRVGTTQTMALDGVTQSEVINWLQHPTRHEEKLRGLSKMLYYSAGEYKSLLQYLTSMARFYYTFEFSGDKESHAPKTIKNQIKILSSEFSKMNIAHEMAKVFDVVMKEDIYYGYEISDDKSFFLMRLDPSFCRLSGQSDGMWMFQFDFSYFDTREHLLNSYPSEFRSKYNKYKNYKVEDRRWQELDFNKSVVFKFHETDREIIPPLASTFSGLMELNEYRKLKKVNARIDNYLILHQKVPMFQDNDKSFQMNNFMLDTSIVNMFHQMLDSSLPDEIGAVISPMDIEPLKLDRTREPSDKVAEATRDIYNQAGVNQYLFNPDKNSTAGLSRSIRKDELLVIQFYLQVARWMQRKIKLNHPKWTHWQVRLLPTTGLSEDEYATFLTNLGTLGFPVVDAIAALLGYDIKKMDSMLYMENEVFKFKERMVPFASSHTGGVNQDEGGRPTKDDTVISESGQANRDSSSNGGDK